MKKVALVFVLAVLLPSLVLAWLAVRSLRDQQFLLERQQSLLDQRVTDTLAQNISDYLAQRQQEFAAQVESLAAAGDAREVGGAVRRSTAPALAAGGGGLLRHGCGQNSFATAERTAGGADVSPDNSDFLGNREPVEVYSSANSANAGGANGGNLIISAATADQPPFGFAGSTMNRLYL